MKPYPTFIQFRQTMINVTYWTIHFQEAHSTWMWVNTIYVVFQLTVPCCMRNTINCIRGIALLRGNYDCTVGELLMGAISEELRKSWQDLIESVDMTQRESLVSHLKKINNDPRRQQCSLMSQQIRLAIRLPHKTRYKRSHWQQGDAASTWPFNSKYLQSAVNSLICMA